MAIITISRGTFAGGKKLAESVAEQNGYQTVSREELYQRAKETYGISIDEASAIMEQAPTQVDHAGERHHRLALGLQRRRLFYALQACLCELVHPDKTVYHGQAGHLLLPGISHLLRVRLIAPRPLRIELCMEQEGLTRVEASKKIDMVDSERYRWVQAFFGATWSDPTLFDLVLNLEAMSLDEAVKIAAFSARQESFKPTKESNKAMKNLCVSSHLLAMLTSHPATSMLDIEADVDEGVARVMGFIDGDEAARVGEVAMKVEGVKKVVFARP